MSAQREVVPETMPTLASRTDAAYLDFVEGFREYLLGAGANFEARLNAALESAGVQDLEDIRRYVHAQPLGQLRDRLSRTQQEMKWHALRRSFDLQRKELAAELAAWDARGPGRLVLDAGRTERPRSVRNSDDGVCQLFRLDRIGPHADRHGPDEVGGLLGGGIHAIL